MRKNSLALLRASLGLLMVVWGLATLLDVQPALAAAGTVSAGLGASPMLLRAFAAGQLFLGVLVFLGLWRSIAYPILFGITLVVALGAWRSILDPWGWFLDGTDPRLFPLLVVLTATLVVWACQDIDALSMDYRRRA